MASLPEREASLFRSVRATKEQKEEALSGRNRSRRDVKHLGIHRRIAASKAGAEQQQFAHQYGMAQRDLLNLEATDRETEQIDLGQPHCLDYGSDMVCHAFHPIARCAGRRGDAAAIEQDDFTAFGQPSVSRGSQWSRPPRKWGTKKSGTPDGLPHRR